MSRSDGGRVLEWSVFPFRESWRRSALVVAVIIACAVVVYLAFEEFFLSLLAVAILTASLFSYFTRTTYRLDDDEVVIRSSVGRTAKKWSYFKRYYPDGKGITLSPFEKKTRLEPFRSVRLLYGSEKDEVVAFVAEKLDGASDAGSSA
jgi:uncharacterized membrane protein YdbT with pleckstrin-like domain